MLPFLAFQYLIGAIATEAWEFVQAPMDLPENPSTWDAGYTAVADPAEQPGGIVTVLKKVATDFARMEAETQAQDKKSYMISTPIPLPLQTEQNSKRKVKF